jgi:hypothetical protein
MNTQAADALMGIFGFKRKCKHRFALDDLSLVNPDSPGNDRVEWPCSECGEAFKDHCGLDISPKHGPTYRK